MRILIVGYGSAGKRHRQILMNEFGIHPDKIVVADPNPATRANYENLWDAMMDNEDFDTVVIASPPLYHLSQIEAALDYGANVMCEKPLCDLGQLKEAYELSARPDIHKVMVAYNYRFNPSLDKSSFVPKGTARNFYYLKCSQYRERPPQWGFLLDHVSHDLDIIADKSGQPLTVERSEHYVSRESEAWFVSGKAGSNNFEINETISLVDKIPRRVVLSTPDGWASISPDPIMFIRMWQSFIEKAVKSEPQYPGFAHALMTQQLLEEVSACQT